VDSTAYNGEHVAQPVTQEVTQMQTYAQPHEMTSYNDQQVGMGDYTQNNYYDQSQTGYYDPTQNMQGYTAEPQSPDNSSSPEYWSVSSGGGWEQQGTAAPPAPEPAPAPGQTQPQVSVKPGYGYFASTEDNVKPKQAAPAGAGDSHADNQDKAKRRANKTQSGSGWFGGIWDKLALRPKNQMILPDDKNPSIVWDDKTKRWVNTDASEDEQKTQLKPPPKASELNGAPAAAPAMPTPAMPPAPASMTAAPTNMGPAPTNVASTPTNLGPAPSVAPQAPAGMAPPAASTNKYKLQRGKSMKSNYVDVMGSNKKPIAGGNPQAFAPMPQAPTNFFIPAPVSGNDSAPVDFLSPSGPVSFDHSTNRADDQPPPGGYGKGNSFYNPTNYKS